MGYWCGQPLSQDDIVAYGEEKTCAVRFAGVVIEVAKPLRLHLGDPLRRRARTDGEYGAGMDVGGFRTRRPNVAQDIGAAGDRATYGGNSLKIEITRVGKARHVVRGLCRS